MSYLNIEEIREIERIVNKTKDGDYTPSPGDILVIVFLLIGVINTILNSRIISIVKNHNILSYINKDKIKEIILIERLLEDLLILTNASRVSVGIFHNGQNIGSFNFKKMSVIYEAKKNKVSSIKDLYKNVDFSKLKTHILRLNSDSFVKYTINDEDILDACKDYLDINDMDTVYSRLLKNDIGEYGVIEIQYLTDNLENINSVELKNNEVEKLYNKISRLLRYVIEEKKIPKYFYEN